MLLLVLTCVIVPSWCLQKPTATGTSACSVSADGKCGYVSRTYGNNELCTFENLPIGNTLEFKRFETQVHADALTINLGSSSRNALSGSLYIETTRHPRDARGGYGMEDTQRNCRTCGEGRQVNMRPVLVTGEMRFESSDRCAPGPDRRDTPTEFNGWCGTDALPTYPPVKGIEVCWGEWRPENMLTVALRTDRFPSETSWKLLGPQNEVVAAGGCPPWKNHDGTVGSTAHCNKYQNGPENNERLFTYEIPLPELGRYTFKIYDAYGDGLCCRFGHGSVHVNLARHRGQYVNLPLLGYGDCKHQLDISYDIDVEAAFDADPSAGGGLMDLLQRLRNTQIINWHDTWSRRALSDGFGSSIEALELLPPRRPDANATVGTRGPALLDRDSPADEPTDRDTELKDWLAELMSKPICPLGTHEPAASPAAASGTRTAAVIGLLLGLVGGGGIVAALFYLKQSREQQSQSAAASSGGKIHVLRRAALAVVSKSQQPPAATADDNKQMAMP